MSNIAQPSRPFGGVTNRQILATVSASCLGWALDLFDLFVLLYVAPVIGKLFFRPRTRCFRWRQCMHRLR